MADYACTVTLDLPRQRISRDLHILVGKVDLTNYNTTGAEITDITGKFISLKRVIVDGFSDNGYLVRWNTTDKCLHAFYPRAAQAAVAGLTITASGAAHVTDAQAITVAAGFRSAVDVAAGSEVANDVDVGEVNFIAIGT